MCALQQDMATHSAASCLQQRARPSVSGSTLHTGRSCKPQRMHMQQSVEMVRQYPHRRYSSTDCNGNPWMVFRTSMTKDDHNVHPYIVRHCQMCKHTPLAHCIAPRHKYSGNSRCGRTHRPNSTKPQILQYGELLTTQLLKITHRIHKTCDDAYKQVRVLSQQIRMHNVEKMSRVELLYLNLRFVGFFDCGSIRHCGLNLR
uniref:Putative alpha-N-arabinofuranosidase C n=1 Tax=Lygus hesperus TaxID=30085 RepID=A0A0A9WC15_LYGHE